MTDIRLSTAVVLGTDVVAALGSPDSPERRDFLRALQTASDVRFLPRPYQRIFTLAVEELEERYPGQPRDKLGQFASVDGASVDTDPYGERMDAEAAKRSDARSVSDRMAIDTYQSYGWLGINDPLRAGEDPPDDYLLSDGADYHETVAALDRLMTSEGGIPFDTVLYRGVSSHDVFPMDRDLTGSEFRDLGYLSTTANFDVAEAFSFPGEGEGGVIMVKMEVRKGDPGILAENEVIQPRGTRWRITGDTFPAPGARTLTMERAA